MTDYLVTDTELDAVADAINVKISGTAQLVFPTGFVSAVNSIQTQKPETTLAATENGTYTPPSGSVYSSVSVDVPQTTVTPLTVTENGTYTAPTGTAYSPVTVDVPTGGGGTTTSVYVSMPSRMMNNMYVYYSAADGSYSRYVLSDEPMMPREMTEDMLSGSLLVVVVNDSNNSYTGCTVTGATLVEGYGTSSVQAKVGIYKVN